jgi:adenylyltransferase/sulfurtransferase
MDDQQLLRYSRQIMLPEVDVDGQQAFLDAHVLIIGLGGLGCPVAMYLASAGVGSLSLVDFDVVDLSNLQRQIAHSTHRVGESKVASAAVTLAGLNPTIAIECVNQKLEGAELRDQIERADVVVDCSDRFSTRFAVNTACVETQTPLVSGAAIRMDGQLAVFDARNQDSPCYQCLYSEGDDEQLSCSESGVLAPMVGVIGSMQALEVLKLLTGKGEPSQGKFLVFDGKDLTWQSLKIPKNPTCPGCSK